MPTYTLRCDKGCQFERFIPLRNFHDTVLCDRHHVACEHVIQAPLMVAATPEVCFDSPIDGKPITSMAAYREDLARNNCQPYDPEMKTDYTRRQKEGERELETAIGETVEEVIEKMPTKERGKLHSELIEQGTDLAYHRDTKEA